MHGDSINGNEPFIMLYNPNLSSKQVVVVSLFDIPKEIRIDIVDVAPTLSFYLRGVQIPMNSMGIAQPYFGPNQTSIQVQVLQQNLRVIST
jgi:hypothetical protein